MTGREWKPGDVAKSEHAGISVVVDRCEKHFARGPHWHHADGGWDHLDDTLSRGKFCPVVVIDPEDRDAVGRLIALYDEQEFAEDEIAEWQAALREFANPTPPKPDEPQGLGAVVEDADGELWIRTCTPCDDCLNKPWQTGPVRRNWQIVTAVKVLSPGVTP